jgi:hypothetical protein
VQAPHRPALVAEELPAAQMEQKVEPEVEYLEKR